MPVPWLGYQCDGSTGRIPEPKNFVPLDRELLRLPNTDWETVGQLVFVSIDPNGISLEEQLGSDFMRLLEIRFGDSWNLYLKWKPQYKRTGRFQLRIRWKHIMFLRYTPILSESTRGKEIGTSIVRESNVLTTQLPSAPNTRFDRVFQQVQAKVLRWMNRDVSSQYTQHMCFRICCSRSRMRLACVTVSCQREQIVVRNCSTVRSELEKAWPELVGQDVGESGIRYHSKDP